MVGENPLTIHKTYIYIYIYKYIYIIYIYIYSHDRPIYAVVDPEVGSRS